MLVRKNVTRVTFFRIDLVAITGYLEGMQAKSRELLNFLLWTAESLTQPTFRNLTESYESWAYRNGLRRQLGELEKQNLLERECAQPDSRIYRLTEEGRLLALGGRDPQQEWDRNWDGLWRVVVFDIPVGQNTLRQRLHRYLKARGFGCLQDSTWITPNPMEEEKTLLRKEITNVESLILLEAQPCSGESSEQVVAGAWKFSRINSNYSRYLQVLAQCPLDPLHCDAAAKRLRRWAELERMAWLEAVVDDPLLPHRLLPRGYMGKRAWRERVKVLGKASRLLKAFRT